MSGLSLRVTEDRFPVDGAFTISRGSRTEIRVVTVELQDGDHVGRGECVPYARYGESIEGVIDLIRSLESDLRNGLDRTVLQSRMPAGAARCGIDCALWDLESKQTGTPAWQLAGLEAPAALNTAFTLSLAAPEAMRQAAAKNAHRPLLKIKLGSDGDLARIEAVRAGAPHATLIVDANEGWTIEQYLDLAPRLVDLGVALIEQPLPDHADGVLADVERVLPVCADESCHDRHSLDAIRGKYDVINIKIDKTGGLTEAIALKNAALAAGLDIMVGCMLGTSLAMAPAFLLAQGARYVDLDGPLLLAKDRPVRFDYDGSLMHPPSRALWG